MSCVTLTEHAEVRAKERGIDFPTIRNMLAAPAICGPASEGLRWASGSFVRGAHREWVTVIYYEKPREIVVVTAYVGPPSRIRTTDAIRAVPPQK